MKSVPKVLANANAVLHLLAQDGVLGHAEIAERTGIPRPSVYRLVDGLIAVKLVDLKTDGGIGLGARCLQLAHAARQSMREWSGAADVLGKLANQTHLTSYVSVRLGSEAMCVEWAQGRDFAALLLRPGRTLPLHAPAEGRLLLAFAGDAQEYTASDALSEPGAPDRIALRRELETIKTQGFAQSSGEVTPGVGALGVPIRDERETVVACVSVAGLTDAVHDRRERLLSALREAAVALEARFTPVPS